MFVLYKAEERREEGEREEREEEKVKISLPAFLIVWDFYWIKSSR